MSLCTPQHSLRGVVYSDIGAICIVTVFDASSARFAHFHPTAMFTRKYACTASLQDAKDVDQIESGQDS